MRFSLLSICLLAMPLAYAAEPAERAALQEQPQRTERPNLITEQAFGNRLDAMATPDVATKEAKYLRNLYKALIAEGFSQEEAFEIVVHHESLLLTR